MSVKGFQVGNNVEKYDYTELVNKPTIPSKTSDLTNDSGFVNASGAASAAPVQSVNGNTGSVTVPTIPSGGTAGQVLAKASSTDLDVEWITPSSGGGNAKTLLLKTTITEEVASIEVNKTDCENFLIVTKGLKTAKTSSMGALITINGSQNSIANKILYQSNVFASIVNQGGYMRIEDLTGGYKMMTRLSKPIYDNETHPLSVGAGNGNAPIIYNFGKINSIIITPSESAYLFTGGDVIVVGW